MRFIFKHVRDRNVQPPSIFILFLIRRRYQDKERVGQSLVFREDNFKSRGVFKWNDVHFSLEKNHALLKSILITTPLQHLQFLEDSLIWALVHGSRTIFLQSRRAQEKSACCNRCSILCYRCDITAYVYFQFKKLHYQSEKKKKKSYLRGTLRSTEQRDHSSQVVLKASLPCHAVCRTEQDHAKKK